jgi:predicted transcriptional regulator
MAPRRTAQPTAAELEILQVVWRCGSASVREVFEALGEEREVGYTTVLKLMQIMHGKNLLTRDASARTHRFTAALEREETQKDIVGNLIAKAFGGSATKLVEAVLAHAKSSKSELSAIHALLAPGKKPAAPAKARVAAVTKSSKPAKKIVTASIPKKKEPAAKRRK